MTRDREPYYERNTWELLSTRDKTKCCVCGDLLDGRSFIHKLHQSLPGDVRACLPCVSEVDAGDPLHPLYIPRQRALELPPCTKKMDRHVFTPEQVNEIRRLHREEGLSQAELGRLYNSSYVIIHNILNYKTYVPKGYRK